MSDVLPLISRPVRRSKMTTTTTTTTAIAPVICFGRSGRRYAAVHVMGCLGGNEWNMAVTTVSDSIPVVRNTMLRSAARLMTTVCVCICMSV